jgi:putative addiction module component (TIGR02574 family)
MKAISEFAREAMELPSEQRLVLARMLIESSDDERDYSSDLELAWDAEISRRMEAVKAGTARSRSLDEVLADLDRRFPS